MKRMSPSMSSSFGGSVGYAPPWLRRKGWGGRAVVVRVCVSGFWSSGLSAYRLSTGTRRCAGEYFVG